MEKFEKSLHHLLACILFNHVEESDYNIMLGDVSNVKRRVGPDALPLAADWGAAGRIHWDRWRSSIHLDQSEGKDGQRRGTFNFVSRKTHDASACEYNGKTIVNDC